jgi:hypothetical protein
VTTASRKPATGKSIARKPAARQPSAKRPDKPTASPRFPIVGIGASAGGLVAIEEFLAAVPTDESLGMALVLVQHLDPDHKSLLLDLIKKYTHLQIAWAEDGMEVRSGRAYVMPPNTEMVLVGGRLCLAEPEMPRGQRLPIDYFFRSLAADQGERAVGIVLSGTGSDGTLGLRMIKGEGGMVIAQDPRTAAYDGMPRSAIATGLVDYVLPPADMPASVRIAGSRTFLGIAALSTIRTDLASRGLRREQHPDSVLPLRQRPAADLRAVLTPVGGSDGLLSTSGVLRLTCVGSGNTCIANHRTRTFPLSVTSKPFRHSRLRLRRELALAPPGHCWGV